MIENSKHQSIFIRGGEAFDNKEQFYEYLRNREYDPYKKWRRWADWLEWTLSEKFESFTPLMPNKQWADYAAWKIWFEKLIPYINKGRESKLVIIGHSLGGLFLAKYLSENEFVKQIHQLHLVAPVFDSSGLVGETTATFELNVDLLKNLSKRAKNIFIYHSKDDTVVPYEHSKKYAKYIPNSVLFSFDGRGHFNQPAFMEIVDVINKYM